MLTVANPSLESFIIRISQHSSLFSNETSAHLIECGIHIENVHETTNGFFPKIKMKRKKNPFPTGSKDWRFSLPIKVQTGKESFGMKSKYAWMLKLKYKQKSLSLSSE